MEETKCKKISKRKLRKIILFVPLMIGLIFGLGALVMVLWNAILPDLIGVKLIGYWQALGLLLLCKILFGGYGSGGKGGKGKRGFGRRKEFMRRKMEMMSDEERAKFKEEWRNRRTC